MTKSLLLNIVTVSTLLLCPATLAQDASVKGFFFFKVGAVEIYVTGNGNGVSDETSNRLFEPFYTTKRESKGIGLGLSISYGIMQKHGGELTVSSPK